MSESEYTTPPQKTCTKCGDAKPHEAFSRQSANKDGLRAMCKACSSDAGAAYQAEHRDEKAVYNAAYNAEHRDEAAAYRAEHREEIAAYHAAYRAEHCEELAAYRAARGDEIAAYHAAYRAEHCEERAAYSADYRAEHREEAAAYRVERRDEKAANDAAYRAEHLEEHAACERNRHARKLGNGGKHSAADIRAQYERQRGKCFWCEGKLDKYHVDHVMPVILGGSNGPENLVISCPTCNLRKGAKHPQNFAGRLL